jgi:hypothetical protein
VSPVCQIKQSAVLAGNGLNVVERKGVEQSTFALRTRQPMVASETVKELAATPESVCTSVCTSEAEKAHSLTGIDAELALLIDRWPALTEATKTAIVAMVRATV